MPGALSDREPQVEANRLIDELSPPPRFAEAGYDNYLPDPSQPTQAAAVAGLRAFGRRPAAPGRRRVFRRAAPPESRAGVYLDGGYGVGKTHLLAALHRQTEQDGGRSAFGTFVEYTNLVGALGFAQAVARLSKFDLVCVDEFELDDPGDTVLISSLLNRLVCAGVRLAATSNTLPDRLGQGRFAAEDFLREIQGLAGHFDVLRIEGSDYRHRGLPNPPPPLADAVLRARAAADPTGGPVLDRFEDLLGHLPRVHPSKYAALLDGVTTVYLSEVRPVDDQAAGLRLVVLADRLYDRDIPVLHSGAALDRLFSPALLASGYKKKYYRALSRLTALAREGAGLSHHGAA